jgi:cellulose synthase/poly-beta-1,6-N-acetylglucosamine synthase-like glycosyltransferase
MWSVPPGIDAILVIVFVATQSLYLLTFVLDGYIFTRPVDRVDMSDAGTLRPEDYPFIVLFYPVLDELETTMRTTFLALDALVYPKDRYRVVAIPNSNDVETIASLERLRQQFSFVEILEVPPTVHPRWETVWNAWENNPKAYWWHHGKRTRNRDLPPKKTRQLIYAFYSVAAARAGVGEDFLVNYIDADSAPPQDHFLAAAVGMRQFDVLQATNVAGNLNTSMAATWHSFDHMTWDGRKYAHLTAGGAHPYWVLGKGLFFRASDLTALGGFHPWISIEDPEVGMRFWKNGKRLGLIEAALIEEVPHTLARGITQRKRWVCGFFESLGEPLDRLGFTRVEKLKAWMNFLPCLSLWINGIGLPLGLWAYFAPSRGNDLLPDWAIALALFNVTLFVLSLTALYASIWRRTALVLARRRDRLWYMLRINPVSLMIWWMIWVVPLWIGWRMYRTDQGLVWERTEKIDANCDLVRARQADAPSPADPERLTAASAAGI